MGTFSSLTNPSKIWGYEEIFCRPNPVLQRAGIYACYFKRFPYRIPVKGCINIGNLTLFYLGISPAQEHSRNHLRNRIRTHYRRNASASTLRLTLGCLLAAQLNIKLQRTGRTERLTFCDGEKTLSNWLAENMFVVWTTCDKPWERELNLINKLSLPLNIQHNANHPFHGTLMNIRAEAKSKARELPVIVK